MAILGLRALYFALVGVMKIFHYLHYGLALILMFVGLKMSLAEFYKISIYESLLFIFFILTVSIIASVITPKKQIMLD
jgi:tellurite resistance protein TerC